MFHDCLGLVATHMNMCVLFPKMQHVSAQVLKQCNSPCQSYLGLSTGTRNHVTTPHMHSPKTTVCSICTLSKKRGNSVLPMTYSLRTCGCSASLALHFSHLNNDLFGHLSRISKMVECKWTDLPGFPAASLERVEVMECVSDNVREDTPRPWDDTDWALREGEGGWGGGTLKPGMEEGSMLLSWQSA
jgi:hypothetical protein